MNTQVSLCSAFESCAQQVTSFSTMLIFSVLFSSVLFSSVLFSRCTGVVHSRSQCEGEAEESGCEIQSRSPQSQLVNEFNSSHSTALRLVTTRNSSTALKLVTTRNNSTALKLDVIVATIQFQLVTRFSQPL